MLGEPSQKQRFEVVVKVALGSTAGQLRAIPVNLGEGAPRGARRTTSM